MTTTMMRELLSYVEYNSGATNILEEQIDKMRTKIAHADDDDDDTGRWFIDLAHFLGDLSEVHCSSNSLCEMKEALNELLSLSNLTEKMGIQ